MFTFPKMVGICVGNLWSVRMRGGFSWFLLLELLKTVSNSSLRPHVWRTSTAVWLCSVRQKHCNSSWEAKKRLNISDTSWKELSNSQGIWVWIINTVRLNFEKPSKHSHLNWYLFLPLRYQYKQKIHILSKILPSLRKVYGFCQLGIVDKWISVALKSKQLLISVLLPQRHLLLGSLNHPFQALLWQIFRMGASLIAD